MQCEICGSEIRDNPFKISIDGSELTVCGKCSQHGNAVGKRAPVSRKVAPVNRGPMQSRNKKPSGKIPGMDLDELVDDYGHTIKEARENKKWTQDQLASKIKEKAALIKKIEREDIVPEEDVRKKIERALDVRLTERRSGDDEWSGDRLNRGTTLGDIVTIKRK